MCIRDRIETASFDPQRNAPILRQASLCDIKIRQNLNPADDSRLILSGHTIDHLQNPVDPVTHIQPGLSSIKMNIRHPSTDGLGEDAVDKLYDRSRLCLFLDIIQLLQLLPIIINIAIALFFICLTEVLVRRFYQSLKEIGLSQA